MLNKLLSLSRFPALFSAITVLIYTSSTASLYFKATLLEQLVKKTLNSEKMILLIAAFAGFHLLASFFRNASIHWRQWQKSDAFTQAWSKYRPNFLTREQAEFPEQYFQHLTNHIPVIGDLKITIVSQITLILYVYGIFIFKIVQDEFWIGIIFIPILGGLSWLSGNFKKNELQTSSNEFISQQNRTMRWCRDYFLSYRERQLNWDLDVSEKSGDWHEKKGNDFLQIWRSHMGTQFKKSLGIFACVDGPFIFSMSLIIGASVYGNLSLTDAVIWIGLLEFLVEANGAIAQTKGQLIQKEILETRVSNDLNRIGTTTDEKQLPGKFKIHSAKFSLKDGTQNILSTKPGLYKIAGSNGSGKSTLINSVLGIEEDYAGWNRETVNKFKDSLMGRTRVIENAPVVFSGIIEFGQQITGNASGTVDQILPSLLESMNHILPKAMADQWNREFIELNDKWGNREANKLSSGESVLLSVARAFYSWNQEVKALVVDESDSFLDGSRQALFMETVEELSKSHAIYYVSHHKTKVTNRQTSIVASSFLLGYATKSKTSKVLELRAGLVFPGKGKITSYGNVADSLVREAEIVRHALVHSIPSLSYLAEADITLEAIYPGIKVSESISSGLAIAIALLNVHRVKNGLKPFDGIAATGQVHLDGGIGAVNHLEIKSSALENEPFIKNLITPKNTNHISDLYQYMTGDRPQISLDSVRSFAD